MESELAPAEQAELLERHRPVLRFDPQYDYRVLAAESAVNNRGNILRRFDGELIARAAGDPPLDINTLTRYPGGLRPRADDCLAMAPDHPGDARRMEWEEPHRGWIYGRVVEDGGRTWLQYWFWLYYNPKNLLGFGKHEGDWEMIQVGLGAGGEPEVATYAQHDSGEARPWREGDMEFAPDDPLRPRGLHRPALARLLLQAELASLLLRHRPSVCRRPSGQRSPGGGVWSVGQLGGPLGQHRAHDRGTDRRWPEKPPLAEPEVGAAWDMAPANALSEGSGPPRTNDARAWPPDLPASTADCRESGSGNGKRALGAERPWSRRGRHLYVTLHERHFVIASRILEDAEGRGTTAFLVPAERRPTAVMASAYNRMRQRSDVAQAALE